MPKLIEHARETLLAAARHTLLTDGYTKLTMRGIAQQCGIAVGTVYNYFPSKDALVAHVILQDWIQSLETIHRACDEADTAMDAVQCTYDALFSFAAIYRKAWNQYEPKESSMGFYRSRHEQLLDQLCEGLSPALTRTGACFDDHLPRFVAGIILSYATQGTLFHIIEPMIAKLLA